MRYAIYDKDGNIKNTIVCSNPDFAALLGAVECPLQEQFEIKKTKPQLREQAYETTPLISWQGKMLTVDEANKLWTAYTAEGNVEAASQLTTLITEAKTAIREKYPDE